MVQAGAYIFRAGCEIGLYLQLYQSHHGKLGEEYLHYSHKMDGHEWTVYTTWQIRFEWLRTHTAEAATFLQHCTYMHHNGISQAIVENATINITSPFDDQEPNSIRNAKELLGVFVTSGIWDTQKFLNILCHRTLPITPHSFYDTTIPITTHYNTHNDPSNSQCTQNPHTTMYLASVVDKAMIFCFFSNSRIQRHCQW